jgi:hypothetical protein
LPARSPTLRARFDTFDLDEADARLRKDRAPSGKLHLLAGLVVILNARPTCPTSRSYVLKLHRDAVPGRGRIVGRLENVSTVRHTNSPAERSCSRAWSVTLPLCERSLDHAEARGFRRSELCRSAERYRRDALDRT